MQFLRSQDYDALIKADNLAQILEEDDTIRVSAELSAISEMRSYIEQRYDCDVIFKGMAEFSNSANYYPGDRVLKTTTTGVSPNQVTVQDIYYVSGTFFHRRKPWDKDDIVIFEGAKYKALMNVPRGIIPVQGQTSCFWQYLSAISAITGVAVTDATKWTKGDNRNPYLITLLVDMILYHLHKRINPRQIPDSRIIAYDGNNAMQQGGAIGWLKRIAGGKLTADLPEIMPEQGKAFSWGSAPKQNNDF